MKTTTSTRPDTFARTTFERLLADDRGLSWIGWAATIAWVGLVVCMMFVVHYAYTRIGESLDRVESSASHLEAQASSFAADTAELRREVHARVEERLREDERLRVDADGGAEP